MAPLMMTEHRERAVVSEPAHRRPPTAWLVLRDWIPCSRAGNPMLRRSGTVTHPIMDVVAQIVWAGWKDQWLHVLLQHPWVERSPLESRLRLLHQPMTPQQIFPPSSAREHPRRAETGYCRHDGPSPCLSHAPDPPRPCRPKRATPTGRRQAHTRSMTAEGSCEGSPQETGEGPQIPPSPASPMLRDAV